MVPAVDISTPPQRLSPAVPTAPLPPSPAMDPSSGMQQDMVAHLSEGARAVNQLQEQNVWLHEQFATLAERAVGVDKTRP
eukprot:15448467-Alexandrium_andersonii.AAC.1